MLLNIVQLLVQYIQVANASNKQVKILSCVIEVKIVTSGIQFIQFYILVKFTLIFFLDIIILLLLFIVIHYILLFIAILLCYLLYKYIRTHNIMSLSVHFIYKFTPFFPFNDNTSFNCWHILHILVSYSFSIPSHLPISHTNYHIRLSSSWGESRSHLVYVETWILVYILWISTL